MSSLLAYADPAYVQSLGEFGQPLFLPRSRGALLKRPVAAIGAWDAMGSYPLFNCSDWGALGQDLAELEGQLVSVALTTDPFGDFDPVRLAEWFPDRCVPFKHHFVSDLRSPRALDKHHRYYVKRALGALELRIHHNPIEYLDEWCSLYSQLCSRHRLTGIKAFSREGFAKQLKQQGMVLIGAWKAQELVSAHLWLQSNAVAYSHLAASNEVGYAFSAAYALYATAIEYFKGKRQWICWGAGAGLSSESNDGLTRFKRGFATGTRQVYFCGRVLNPAKYAEFSSQPTLLPSRYFPAYRSGELG